MARSKTTFQSGHKHSEETLKKISNALKGKATWNKNKKGVMPTPWNKGKKLSKEHIEKLKKSHTGYKMSDEQKERISKSLVGRKKEYKISREELADIRRKQFYSRKFHPRWKGGITPLNSQIRHHFKMRQWISDIFTRDDFVCQGCGERGGKLVAHHIYRFSDIMRDYNIRTLEDALNCEEMWNINNGVTLCEKCHKKIPCCKSVILSGDNIS